LGIVEGGRYMTGTKKREERVGRKERNKTGKEADEKKGVGYK
jgi:hypothetical protein